MLAFISWTYPSVQEWINYNFNVTFLIFVCPPKQWASHKFSTPRSRSCTTFSTKLITLQHKKIEDRKILFVGLWSGYQVYKYEMHISNYRWCTRAVCAVKIWHCAILLCQRVRNWKGMCVVLCSCVRYIEIYTEQRTFGDSINFQNIAYKNTQTLKRCILINIFSLSTQMVLIY